MVYSRLVIVTPGYYEPPFIVNTTRIPCATPIKNYIFTPVKGYSSLSEEVTDSLLDKEIEKGEITKCLRNLKNSKTGGSDDIVGELLKYGGFGMVDLLEQLFSVIWQEEIVPRQWREGLIVNNLYLRKGAGKTLLTTGVLPCLVL